MIGRFAIAVAFATLSVSTVAQADLGDWEVVSVKEKNSALLRHRQNLKLSTRLMADIRGRPVLKSARAMSKNKDIECITYFAGEFGTHSLEPVYRAALYDTKAKEFIGDFPIAAPTVSMAGAKPDPFAPIWSETPGRITIDEPQDLDGALARTEIDVVTGLITTTDIVPEPRELAES